MPCPGEFCTYNPAVTYGVLFVSKLFLLIIYHAHYFIYHAHYLYIVLIIYMVWQQPPSMKGLTTASLHEKSGSLCTYVRIWFLTFRPTARTLVTSNADWSWKMRASCDSQCARPSSSSGVACWSLTVGWHFSRFSPFFLTVFQPWFQPTEWNFCQLYRISEFN